jgi:hypothetical protein
MATRLSLLLLVACTVGGESALAPPELVSTDCRSAARSGDDLLIARTGRGQGVWRQGTGEPQLIATRPDDYLVDLVANEHGFAAAFTSVLDLSDESRVWLYDLRTGVGHVRERLLVSGRQAAIDAPLMLRDDELIVAARWDLHSQVIVGLPLDGDGPDREIFALGDLVATCGVAADEKTLIILTGPRADDCHDAQVIDLVAAREHTVHTEEPMVAAIPVEAAIASVERQADQLLLRAPEGDLRFAAAPQGHLMRRGPGRYLWLSGASLTTLDLARGRATTQTFTHGMAPWGGLTEAVAGDELLLPEGVYLWRQPLD